MERTRSKNNSAYFVNYFENCLFCKKCTIICPMYTIELVDEDTAEKRIVIDYDRCIGCGVFAYNCPKGALTIVKKFSKIPATDSMEAAKRYMEGRIQ